MAKIKQLTDKHGEILYPVSKEAAIFDENGVLLSNKISTFITRLVDNLANYYLKSEIYTKEEIDTLIGAIQGFSYIVVSELPIASAFTMGTIYLVPSEDPQTQNIKDEYITIRSGSIGSYTYSWEQIGSTAIDLSGYVTTEALNAELTKYTTTANLTTLLAAKQDTIADLSTIRNGASAGATAYQKPASGIPTSDMASDVQTSLGKADTAYQKPASGIPASDIASGVIPTVPTISTDVSADAASDVKTSSPKSVKTYVDAGIAAVESDLSDLADEVEAIDIGAYDVAWDGSSAPVVANIPAGVVVTYGGTSYTGTLAASASTKQKIYLVATGTTDNYDRYVTVGDSTYSWVNIGTTEITLANYATKSKVEQLEAKVGGNTYFFECSTDGSTAAKVVNDQYVDFVLGPYKSDKRLVIRMLHKNTVASGVTLNINGTGAKNIYYNYGPVNATNTWEDYDYLEVIYNRPNGRYECWPILYRTDMSITNGRAVPSVNSVRAAINSAKSELQTSIDSVSNSALKWPSIPKSGYGRMILSLSSEQYTHNPKMVFRDKFILLAYHASVTGKIQEDPTQNVDYIRVTQIVNNHPNVVDSIIIASDRAEDGAQFSYNGYTARCIYNHSMWMVAYTAYIKFSAQINGVPYWFYDTINPSAPLKPPYYSRNPRPLKLNYTNGGSTVSEDFSKANYINMLNVLYNANMDATGNGLTMDITNVVYHPATTSYYMMTTYYDDATMARPCLIMKSQNGVDWSPLFVIGNLFANEASIQIVGTRIHILFRAWESANNEGVWYMCCDLDGQNKTTPIKVSDVPSLPATFIFNGGVYGVYNIPSSVYLPSARTRVQIAKLNADGTKTDIKTISSVPGLAYNEVINFRGYNLLFMASAEMNNAALYGCDIAFSELSFLDE